MKHKKTETKRQLDKSKFEILGTDNNSSVENYYVYIKGIDLNKDSLQLFVDMFREEYCKTSCNINILDNKMAYPNIRKYPLEGKEYLNVADHYVASSDFSDYAVWMYPYQDIKYKELGGKNWKK